MKINVFKSLGAKLFYLMTGLTLVVIIGISLQSTTQFREFLVQQLQDGTTLQAERSASDISGTFENWIGQMSAAVPSLSREGVKKEEAVNFVQSNAEFVGFSVFVVNPQDKVVKNHVFGFTTNDQDQRFEGHKASDIFAKITTSTSQWIEKDIKNKAGRFFLTNVSPVTKVPMMQLAVRFDVDKQKTYLMAVLTTWQTKIALSLPKTRFTISSLLDSKGNVFSSPIFSEAISRKSLKHLPLTKQALAKRTPSGFQDAYKDKKGKRWLGAYSILPKFDGLSVIVQKDADAAFMIITKSLTSAALWAVLFVLIAVALSYLGASRVTRSLREVVEATQNIASGNFSYRLQPQSADEIAALSHSVNNMASKITSLMQSQVDKARFEKELETARMVQSTFFPKKDIARPHISVTGFYQPATQCGGDLWGHFTVRENVELVFIADAMGHGAPAALVTAMAYATCQATADVLRHMATEGFTPAQMLSRLNRIIYEAVEGKISMTFFVALMDFSTGSMQFANAGHNFPVVIPANPKDPRLKPSRGSKDKEGLSGTISLILQGVPLGVEPEAAFKEKTFQFAAGDKFFLFTDGLIECQSPTGDAWGRKVLLEKIGRFGNLGPVELKDAVLKDAMDFFNGRELADDITIVTAEIDKNWKPQAHAVPSPPDTQQKKFNVKLPGVA